ncbi:hypothetical protein D3C80_1691610 [compost metagenome]
MKIAMMILTMVYPIDTTNNAVMVYADNPLSSFRSARVSASTITLKASIIFRKVFFLLNKVTVKAHNEKQMVIHDNAMDRIL